VAPKREFPVAKYERLGVLDRFFLDMEGHDTHMHIAATMLFDAGPLRTEHGGIDIRKIRAYIESRLHLIPRYRQRLAFVPIERHPVWIDDDRMNIRYHVRHASLPRPGDIRQLKRLAGRIMSQQLDRGKPLWEMWVVEGLEDDRFALITKTHHCMIDGVSGVDLMTVLLGMSPDAVIEEAPTWSPDRAPTSLELARDEILRRSVLPFTLVGEGLRILADPRAAWEHASEIVSALTQVASMGLRSSADTPLNRPVGAYRRFDWTTFDLDRVKVIKNELGGTVNDVVLATVAGAIGKFLELRGVSLLDQQHMRFRAFCPVSVRSDSDRGRLGNQVSGMIVELPIAERDPGVRLAMVSERTGELKEVNQALGAEILTAVSDWTTPTLLGLGARVAVRARAYNTIVTNVPGPQLPLYLLGARMVEAFPLVPLFINQALGIALFSYYGKLCFGINADWDLLPDLHRLLESLNESFEELAAAADGTSDLMKRARGPRHTNGRGASAET
jgi:WS/DGAT/MGAT family acyltransferase